MNSDGKLNESTATLRIMSKLLLPEEITERVGIKPTTVQSKGKVISNMSGKVHEFSFWFLEAPLEKERDLEDHLSLLLKIVSPHKSELKKLSEEEETKCDILCSYSSYAQGGFCFSNKIISEISCLEIDLLLDFYAMC